MTEFPIVENLIKEIGERNILQAKYLGEMMDKDSPQSLSEDDLRELEKVCEFFSKDYSVKQMAMAYILFLEDTLAETKYFVENESEHYRYSTFAEVNSSVYQDAPYMSQYMLGLQLSGYFWENHRRILHWFRKKSGDFSGEHYLEIGPGHGQYFTEAMNMSKFKDYTAIDLSQTSLDMTRRYIDVFATADVRYNLILDDFLEHCFDMRFDGVCISEVLEHVEKPFDILKRIHSITNDDADIYVNVPINAPAVDHIYLYKSLDEVRELVKEAGFRIMDELPVPANNKKLEKAIAKKFAINFAFCMKKA